MSKQSTSQLGHWSWDGDIFLKILRDTGAVEGCGEPLLSRLVSWELAWPTSDRSTRRLEDKSQDWMAYLGKHQLLY